MESIATELESIATDRVTYLVTFYALREKSKNNSRDKPRSFDNVFPAAYLDTSWASGPLRTNDTS